MGREIKYIKLSDLIDTTNAKVEMKQSLLTMIQFPYREELIKDIDINKTEVIIVNDLYYNIGLIRSWMSFYRIPICKNSYREIQIKEENDNENISS